MEEAALASCRFGWLSCSGREEEERGVEREKELEVGVDANLRLLAGDWPSLEVGVGEGEDSEGGAKDFMIFGFEVFALALITLQRVGVGVEQVATCRSHDLKNASFAAVLFFFSSSSST